MMRLRPATITAVGNLSVAGNGGATLWSVNINTGASSGVLKIYNDTSAVAANLIATIDASQIASLWYGVYCDNGLFVVLSGGNADVTIGYS